MIGMDVELMLFKANTATFLTSFFGLFVYCCQRLSEEQMPEWAPTLHYLCRHNSPKTISCPVMAQSLFSHVWHILVGVFTRPQHTAHNITKSFDCSRGCCRQARTLSHCRGCGLTRKLETWCKHAKVMRMGLAADKPAKPRVLHNARFVSVGACVLS